MVYQRDGSEDDESDEDEDDDENSELEEEDVMITVRKMPCCCIAMDKMDNTLDSLLDSESITSDELRSALFQVVITLATYNKLYKFAHNDLHTNNIMYQETNEEFLYYKLKMYIIKYQHMVRFIK